jgi:hypothetical protein
MKRPNYLLRPLRSLRRRARRPPPGSSPGLLRSDPAAPQPRITLLAYGPDSLTETEVSGPEALAAVRGTAPVVWINVDGVGHAETVRDPHPAVAEETRVYLRDCHDHVIQAIDLVESYRDLTSSLTDLYLSLVGQRTNEIMKVLTIFAAIFIPLTFIAGIYGMNFDHEASPFNMPELHWFWGYPFALGLMALVAIGMLFYFHRKGWIGEPG